MFKSRSEPHFKPVVEDTIQCLFFFTSLSDSDRTSWEQRCNDINNIIEKIADNYIWHKDNFRLFLPISNNKHNSLPLHLASSTCFGDNIEDEWFIVYIVLQLTKQYEDLIVQLTDNDGQFLLIEAANLLPSWANPENTNNRVFIANNHIHIIEPDAVNLDMNVDLHDAIKIVSSKQTYTSSDIDNKIISKTAHYPEKIENNLHKALVNLPVSIATLLFMEPKLIAPIVCAYCDHDVIDAKVCQNISFENCVTVKVTFTKFLYAMLAHTKLLKCNKRYSFIAEKNKKDMIGFKLTCGFQMIMDATNDIFSTKEYYTFLSSLKDNGYFKNNIEGSKEYAALIQEAKRFFTNVECPMNSYVCNKISETISTKEYANEMERILINNLSSQELIEDSEDWLNIQPDQLNEFLNINYGKKTKLKKDDIITPEVITSELSTFLTKTSDFEGIETYDEDDNNVNFEADEFSACLEKMLNLLTTTTENNDLYSDTSDTDEINADRLDLQNNSEDELDIELQMKLNNSNGNGLRTHNIISHNMIQSIKEEQASSGPSSNLLKSVGMYKWDVLGSGDDNID